jgi:hypothetical protein
MGGHVVTVVTTPDGERIYRVPDQAFKKAIDLHLENSWQPGYFVTLTTEIREREVGLSAQEDPHWLERQAGRIPADVATKEI